MNTKLIPVSWAILVCWLVLISADWSVAQSPKWKFKVDDTYEVSLTQTTNIKSQIDQRVKTVENELTINFDWKVLGLGSDNTGKIECSISSIQMKMESMPNGVGKSFDIDTDSEERKKGAEKDLLQKLMPLIDTKFIINIKESGEVQQVVIPEESLESLRKVPESMRLRRLMTVEGAKELFGQSMVVFPSGSKAGEPWNTVGEYETSFGNFTRTDTIHWNPGEGNLANIALKTELDSASEPKPDEAKMVGFEGQGTAEFDVEKGYCMSSQMTNQLKTEKPYREKTITTTVNTVVEMNVKRNE